MPTHKTLVFFGLLGVCLAIVVIAWATDSEFYLFLSDPELEFDAPHPPTPAFLVIVFLLTGGGAFLRWPRIGLIILTGLLGTILLGSIVGYLAFAWTPTLVQWLLTAAMSMATIYGWANFGNRFD
jgi:hypothetical protein